MTMQMVNMLQAKSNLSKLAAAIESGEETEIILARNGRPVARIVPLAQPAAGKRIGVAAGHFVVPTDIDADNDEIRVLFDGTL